MLTDRQIEDSIKSGRFSVAPFHKKNIRTSRYNVHLGSTILKPINIGQTINPADPKIQPEYQEIDILNSNYVLKSGDFVLGQTLEKVGLDSDLGLFVDGSSTLARLGLSICQTASFITPGQDPHIIVLEFYNAGPWNIELSYNLKIGKLIVFRSSEMNRTPMREFNRYGGQSVSTGAIILENNED